ncbi:hypothetical protein, partial [Akkermansia sp.]|uniref:hypothetical protein n=2 Tax=Akkermansia sp. TaxID=1872421 RepID=UPI003A8AACCB
SIFYLLDLMKREMPGLDESDDYLRMISQVCRFQIFLSLFWIFFKCRTSLKARLGDCYNSCGGPIESQTRQRGNF